MSYVYSLTHAVFPNDDQNGANRNRVQKIGEEKGNGQQHNGGYPTTRQQYTHQRYFGHPYDINCQWGPFRKLILMQWPRLMPREVDEVGPNRSRLAELVQQKYGVSAEAVKNYLSNVERMLPVG